MPIKQQRVVHLVTESSALCQMKAMLLIYNLESLSLCYISYQDLHLNHVL